MKKIKILSITPHLGGGAGNAIKTLALCKDKYDHKIASLDITLTPYSDTLEVFQNMYNDIDQLMRLIEETDIVLIHWWNHPMLFDLLVNYTWPECRIVMWSLASCLAPPYTHSEKLLNFSDRFIFTSPVSFESPEIKELPTIQKDKLNTIWASGDFSAFKNFKKKKHKRFNVGTIIGSADYSKLNPNFIKIYSLIDVPDIHFTIICSEDFSKQLKKDIEKECISDRITIKTNVSNIFEYLETFDVFSYPLQPFHFGTCELALGEAMLSGVPPIVFSNPTENYIVDHLKTGCVADTIYEYAQYILYLYNNPRIRKEMGKKAIKSAKKLYSLKLEYKKWGLEFNYLMTLPKSQKKWDSLYNTVIHGSSLFCESLGRYGHIFYEDIFNSTPKTREEIYNLFQSNPQWYSKNKGGVNHYLQYFPEDTKLKEWKKLLGEIE